MAEWWALPTGGGEIKEVNKTKYKTVHYLNELNTATRLQNMGCHRDIRLSIRQYLPILSANSFSGNPVLNSNLAVFVKFRSLANHGTPWLRNKILHRCDIQRHCRNGNQQRWHHLVF